jgi:Domain of unknown function (DUF5666)
MRKKTLLILIGVLGVILVGAISLVLAFTFANPSQASTTSATPTASVTFAQGTATTKKVRKITGVIQSVSAQGFVLQATNGKKTTAVTVDNTTKYSSVAGPISFSDLKVGMTVAVRGTFDKSSQTVLASRVTVVAPTGNITAISSQTPPTLTLSTTTSNNTVTVHMTGTTAVLVAGVPVKLSFLVVGQTVSYSGTTAGDGSVMATAIYLVLTKVQGTVNGLSGSNVLSIQPTIGSPVSVNLSTSTTIVQNSGGKGTGTSTIANPTAIHMSAKVVVYDNSKIASSTPTAVLIVVGS